jgi:hypothetical protein
VATPDVVVKKSALKRFVPAARDVHQLWEFSFTFYLPQEWISDEVWIGKEAVLDAVAQHA